MILPRLDDLELASVQCITSPMFLVLLVGISTPCLILIYLYLQERVTSTNPGMQIDFRASTTENLREFKDQFSPFCGLFHCDVFSETKYFDGTLFRLPFRTKQTARKSKISQEVYLKERIDRVVKMVCNKASAMLMFLHNIKSISLYELRQQKAMECLLHVERGQTQPKIVTH